MLLKLCGIEECLVIKGEFDFIFFECFNLESHFNEMFWVVVLLTLIFIQGTCC